MRRILIVANRTLGGEHLRRKVAECMAEQRCWFYVLVPATPNTDHPLVWTEGQARAQAQRRLNEVLHRLDLLGAHAEGEVCGQRALEGIGDVLRARHFDEIVISTLPINISRWLGKDLPRRVARQFALPVTHIVAGPIRAADLDTRDLAPVIALHRRGQPASSEESLPLQGDTLLDGSGAI